MIAIWEHDVELYVQTNFTWYNYMFCMDATIVSLVHSMHVCSLIRSVQSCLICMCVAVNEVGKCVISHCHHSADTVCVCVSVVLHGHRPVVVREEKKKAYSCRAKRCWLYRYAKWKNMRVVQAQACASRTLATHAYGTYVSACRLLFVSFDSCDIK
jgi:hypothetical protein